MCTVIVTVPMYLFTRENNCKIDVTYSGTSIQGTPSGSRKVSPEWRLGWGLLLINLQIEYFFFKSAFEFAVVNICSSRIMHKKVMFNFISAKFCVSIPQMQYIPT